MAFVGIALFEVSLGRDTGRLMRFGLGTTFDTRHGCRWVWAGCSASPCPATSSPTASSASITGSPSSPHRRAGGASSGGRPHIRWSRRCASRFLLARFRSPAWASRRPPDRWRACPSGGRDPHHVGRLPDRVHVGRSPRTRRPLARPGTRRARHSRGRARRVDARHQGVTRAPTSTWPPCGVAVSRARCPRRALRGGDGSSPQATTRLAG